jgi:uncharacterized protein
LNTAQPEERSSVPPLQVILKVASRCNLNCSYCYVYNKGDVSWRRQPKFMTPVTFKAALQRTREHCERSGQDSVRITFHGGEPLLAGVAQFAQWCEAAHQGLGDLCRVDLSVQTNGTLVDQGLVEVFRRYAVSVGISLDGPADINDQFRVDHAGRGSYAQAARGLRMLREHGVPFQVLCVLPFGGNSLRIHHAFVSLGAKRINYLLPDYTHDSIGDIRSRFGPTPCADALIPILEEWFNNSLQTRIGMFWNMARVILGGDSHIDLLGDQSRYQYVFVETGGDIEGLDVLRICRPGLPATGLHVSRDAFADIANTESLHRSVIFEGIPLPTGCRACPERHTCGGGYLPHRFSAQRGFDNPTVWCPDMLRMFGRLRELLAVDVEETAIRRTILMEMANATS